MTLSLQDGAIPQNSEEFHAIKSPINGADLRQALTAIATDKNLDDMAKRMAVLGGLREAQKTGRDIAEKQLEDGAPGLVAARLIGLVQDTIIQVLYDYTTIHIYRSSNPTEAERLSIVAVGGYGRWDLAPGSDLDLLFVLPYKQTPWGESVVEYMLYILWDLGLKVGHATRTIAQCVQLSKEDMTIRTTLLDMRFLWGDKDLCEDLRQAFWKDVVPGTDRSFIDAKMQERDGRHQRAGESRYLVEPNIKEGKGGLRDLHTLFWIAKYVYRVEDPLELVKAGLFTDEEYTKMRDAYDFLWTVRCHLHFLTGRAEERLSFDVQLEMAERMNFNDTESQSAVEHFMKAYFRVAKDVGDLTRIFCAALAVQEEKPKLVIGRLLKLARRPKVLEEGFYEEQRWLRVTGVDVFKRNPVNLIKVFQIADEYGRDIHPETLKVISRSWSLIDDDLRENADANRLFLDILTSPRDPEWALRRMSEAGVLGRFVPAFGLVEAMMQFNMYHHYTVDEHTIRAIGILAQIDRGELAEEHPLSHEIIHKVLSREVLYVALLLHDIAKGRKDDHSEAGAKLALELGPRFGLSKAESQTTAWLVKHHLMMSEYAQSRDTSDPKTIEAFTKIVQSPERLRLLLILTVADIRAVGPGVWNGWKGQLLRDLYYEAESVLQGEGAPGSGTQREARAEAARDALANEIKDWKKPACEQALAEHNESYWLSFDLKDHLRFAKLMRKRTTTKSAVITECTTDTFMSITEVFVYAPNQFGLFSKLAGAVALSGATIMDAKAFSMEGDHALDLFFIQDATGAPFDDPKRIKRLKKTIKDAISGDLLPQEHLARPKLRKRERAFSVEPEVLVDNQVSEFHTLVEVSARDRPGLLFDLTAALLVLRIPVVSAHVSTYGERAVDVFYVKDRAGLKITNETAIANLKKGLLNAIIEGDEGGAVAAE